MKQSLALTLVCSFLALTACQKKTAEVTPTATQEAVQTTAAQPAEAEAAPAELTAAQKEKAEKLAQMEYAVMEDSYINDPKAQWAKAAKVSSVFGQDKSLTEASTTDRMNGKVDGDVWRNNQQDMGFDWAELEFEKPVLATEVRVVIPYGQGVEAISKIELQDPSGKWNTAWSGISEQKQDQRGSRTWFVQKFEKTSYPVKAVKITIANNLFFGYKEFDAVQLVGE